MDSKLVLLFLFLIPIAAIADGPRYQHKDTFNQQEFENIYQRMDSIKSSIQSNYRINVRDYGAAGDGKTDDTAAFNAAKTAALALIVSGYNVSLYAPTGVYKIGFAVGATSLSIEGDPGSTFFVPVDSTTFILSFIGDAGADRRYVTGIYFYGAGTGGVHLGRGVYVNSLSYIEFQNDQFQTLEYGVYSNGSEWNHFFNCHFVNVWYGVVATTKNNDVLGLNPINNQNSAASWFSQCDWYQNKICFYTDDVDNTVGDHQPAFHFSQCEILTSTIGIAAIYPKYTSLYYPMVIDYAWMEQNGGSYDDSLTFNGNTLKSGDIYMSGGEISINHVMINGRVNFNNSAKVSGYDFKMDDAAQSIVSTDTICSMTNVQLDFQNGDVMDWCNVTTLQSYNNDRPAMARTHPHGEIKIDGSLKNKLSGTTASCSTGTLPVVALGAPFISFFNGDGFYNNTSVKISGVAGDAARWIANVSNPNWYVVTFCVRGSTEIALQNSTFTISNNTNIIFPTGRPIRLSPAWRSYASIGQPSGSGTIGLDFTLATATTIYVSLIQVVEFPSKQEAIDFYDSNTFLIPSSEFGGYFKLSSQTKSQILALVPGVSGVGQFYYCSDCVTETVCISTGTAAGQFSGSSGRANSCK